MTRHQIHVNETSPHIRIVKLHLKIEIVRLQSSQFFIEEFHDDADLSKYFHPSKLIGNNKTSNLQGNQKSIEERDEMTLAMPESWKKEMRIVDKWLMR